MSNMIRYQRLQTSQNLASGALSYTTTFTGNVQIAQIIFHSSIAISQTITTTFVARESTNYSAILDTTTLSSASNYVFRPSGGCILMDGDQLTIACTNSGTPAAVLYCTIIAEPYGSQPVSAAVANAQLT